jgi:leukotriene-A4 hydrolase
MSVIVHDPNTESNINDVITQHLSIRWNVDFAKSVISGSVTLNMLKVRDGLALERVILDTRDLTITKVTVDGAEAKFALGKKADLSTPLTITLPTAVAANGATFTVAIDYSTSPEATAVQWLTPEQTAGMKHPYLFTQCQAIHARSLLPVQDSPSIKLTYDAVVTVPQPLVALMSALAVDDASVTAGSPAGTRSFAFKQPVPIPSYLIALAVGNLVSKPIGPRSVVWSEPETVDAGAFEFAETEKVWQSCGVIVQPLLC